MTALNGSVAHAVLTRNEFGAGFYHVLLDTLASLAFVLDEAPRGAKLLLNPCTTGREHLTGSTGGRSPTRHCMRHNRTKCE